MRKAWRSPAPDRKELRKFGLLLGGVIVLLFGLLLPWLRGHGFPAGPWLLGGALAAWALAASGTLGLPYRAWMVFGCGLGWINTRILLGAVFFLMVVPMAMVMRFAGRDPMARTFDPALDTYRKESVKTPRERMEAPY
jgi:hypothetical protein